MAKKRVTGLGSLGVDALLSAKVSTAPTAASAPKEYAHIGIERIRPNPHQPRARMDPEALSALAESIKSQGLIQPLLVRPLPQAGEYELVAGERRWRAAQQIGLETLPAVIRKVSEQDAAILALVENIQRADLDPMEEAAALRKTIQSFDLTHDELAEMVGRSRPAVSNLLRLLELDEEVQKLCADGHIEEGHARALLRLKKSDQLNVAQTIIAKALTVRQTEEYVARLLGGGGGGGGGGSKPAEIRDLEDKLQDRLGTTVDVQHRKSGKGKLVISYSSLDILDGILQKIH